MYNKNGGDQGFVWPIVSDTDYRVLIARIIG